MSTKLHLAAATLVTCAVFGFSAGTSSAQTAGGFLHVDTGDVAFSIGAGQLDRGWRTVRRRVWHPGYYRVEYVPPLYQTRFRRCGTPYRIVTRAGFDRRVWIPGRYRWIDRRVRIDRRLDRRFDRRLDRRLRRGGRRAVIVRR